MSKAPGSTTTNGPPITKSYFEQQRSLLVNDIGEVRPSHSPWAMTSIDLSSRISIEPRARIAKHQQAEQEFGGRHCGMSFEWGIRGVVDAGYDMLIDLPSTGRQRVLCSRGPLVAF